MFYRLLIAILFSSVFIVSCQKEDITIDEQTNNGNNNGSSSTIVYNVDKTKMLQLVNNVRQAGCNCGNTSMPPVASVTWNDKLAKAAFDHSADMLANDYFSHTVSMDRMQVSALLQRVTTGKLMGKILLRVTPMNKQ
jgi:uncharacterized protein YkwD